MNENNYFELCGMFFSNDTDKKFASFLVEANRSRKRVVIEYNVGWEDFSGYHGGNGLKHSIYVGKSTGIKPIPLSISRRDSMGGGGLITCRKAIKRYYTK